MQVFNGGYHANMCYIMKLVIHATLFVSCFINISMVLSVTRYSSDYPHDIPLNATTISIYGTRSEQVDYIEPFTKLISYKLTRNIVSTFPNLSNISSTLFYLTITFTHISTLSVDDMAPMSKVKLFDISCNRLTHIPDITTAFPALQKFVAPSNEIVTMTRSMAGNVYLNNNRMTRLPDLSNVRDRIYILTMSGNNISDIPDGTFPLLPVCSYLDLSRNGLTKFPDLSNVTNLEYLYLSSNKIGSIPHLPQMTSLLTLELNDNNLAELPDLTNLSSRLSHLELKDNEIYDFPEDFLVKMTRLRTLTLGRRSSNATKLPNFFIINSLYQLDVTIYNSPLVCDQNAFFTKLLQLAGKLTLSFPGDHPTTCISPVHLSGRKFENITLDELRPQSVGKYLTCTCGIRLISLPSYIVACYTYLTP